MMKKNKAIQLIKKCQSSIPEQYNQMKLLPYLLDKNIDWLVSISSRTDGKTTNFRHFLTQFAYKLDIRFLMIVRHYDLQSIIYDDYLGSMETLGYSLDDFFFQRTGDYVNIFYKNKSVGLIVDLNNASDLRNLSSLLKKYPLLFVDEFLSLKGDYLSDEWEKLKTIYESVDRNEDIPYIHTPKIILAGNAVNFDSPLLAHLDLFSILEHHPMGEQKVYGNISLEMIKNENRNTKRNLRAFQAEEDAMTTAQFDFNTTFIVTREQKIRLTANCSICTVKIDNEHLLTIYYTPQNEVLLKVVVNQGQPYDFCMTVKDIKDQVIYCKENFFRDNYLKKYVKGEFLFDNAYTKNICTSEPELAQLKIWKIIGLHRERTQEQKKDFTEEIYRLTEEERTLNYLYRKFFE